jgi:hypothetical protein
MTILSSLLYLALCAYLARQAAQRLVARCADVDARLMVCISAFSIAFFAPFHLLGYLDLATRAGLVSVPNALAILAVPALATVVAQMRWPVELKNAPRRGIFELRIAQATALAFCLVAVVLAFAYPLGYEAVAYHLPNAVDILQTHSLRGWDANFPHTFPANASIFAAFNLGMLPEKLVSTSNMIFLLPLFLGVVATSRMAGADHHASVLVACGLLGVPMIAFSATALGSDLGALTFILAAMYFALCRSLMPLRRVAMAGLCAGLAFGFKSLHLISIAFLGLMLVSQGFVSGATARDKLREGVRFGAIFCFGILLTAGFWLVRNYLVSGNPFHPINLPVLTDLFGWKRASDVDLLSRQWTQFEWVRSSAEWLLYPWVEWQNQGLNFKESAGLGAFVAAGVPVSLFAVASHMIRRGYRTHRALGGLFFATVFIGGIWWLLGDRQPRYVLAGLVFSMPLVAWLLTQANGRWRRLFDVVLSICIVATLLIVVSMNMMTFGDNTVLSRSWTRAQIYEYPQAIDSLPPGSTILNMAERPWQYPLAGARLSNRIISMPEGRRVLGMPPDLGPPSSVTLRAGPLQAIGVTHVFVEKATLLADRCIKLQEIARFDRIPSNGKMLEFPRRLLEVRYARPPRGVDCD